MKSKICLLITLCLTLISHKHVAQTSKARIKPKASWIEEVSFDRLANPPVSQQSSYYYLLLDEQDNVAEQEKYIHFAYKIITSEGLQEMSDLSFDFDPAYQELNLHAVNIHRGDSVINKLPREIRTIQREESMDRFLYDGTLTTIINLTDIRVGDIIEYAFTRRGLNPVLKGNLDLRFYTSYNVGYEKMFRKLILPSNSNLSIKHYNEAPEPTTVKGEKITSYIWQNLRNKEKEFDSNVPSWYDSSSYIQVSSFKSWGEVVSWAEGLFEVPAAEKLALQKQILSKFPHAEKEKFALDVVRFVQDEIRYLGFESGLNSHLPHSPLKVFNQRFGDCKDKSLLLCTLLRAMEIEAHPVLVNTSAGSKISQELPAAFAFDHCVVVIFLGNKTVFIDPTINNQGGDIFHSHFPRYGKGLIINEGIEELTTFPESVESTISEVQSFAFTSSNGPGTLKVNTIYKGGEADAIRSYFARNSLESIQNNYLTFYRNTYSDMDTISNMSYADDRDSNVFTIHENYTLPTMWRLVEAKEHVSYAHFYPQSLETYFNVSNFKARSAPYAISYPVDYHHEIRIKVPDDHWSVASTTEKIHTDFYQYDYSVTYDSLEILLSRHYKTFSSSIPADDYKQYVDDHQKIFSNLTYELTFDKKIARAAEKPWPGITVNLLVLLASVAGVLWLARNYNPQPHYPPAWGIPIGGWLILPAFGAMVSPIRTAIDFFSSPKAISGETWYSWFAAGKIDYAAIILTENIFHIGMFVFSILLSILFFQRRSSLPKLMCIYLAVRAIFLSLDSIAAVVIMTEIGPNDISYRELFVVIVSAAIWIPYFTTSTRVKRTFVNGGRDANNSEAVVSVQPVEVSGFSSVPSSKDWDA